MKTNHKILYGYIYEVKSNRKVLKVGFSYSKSKIKVSKEFLKFPNVSCDIVKIFLVEEILCEDKRYQKKLGETIVNQYLRENKIYLDKQKGNSKMVSIDEESEYSENESLEPIHSKKITHVEPVEISYYSESEYSENESECESESENN